MKTLNEIVYDINPEPGTFNLSTGFQKLQEIASNSEAILLIAKERKEQIEVHGHMPVEDDILENANGELLKGAKYILTRNDMTYPKNWSKKWKQHLDEKSEEEQLVIAATLIAAEIDRRINATTP